MAESHRRGVARAVAVTGSCALFALAVLQAQQGCDRREPEPEPTPSPAGAEPLAPAAAAKPEPPVAAPTANAAPEPVTTPEPTPEPPPVAKPTSKPKPKERTFFPASKSGGLHMLNPAPSKQESQQQSPPSQTDE